MKRSVGAGLGVRGERATRRIACRASGVVMLLVALASVPRGASAQSAAVRFDIRNIGDSTFSFALGSQDWVRQGQQGIVVDPSRRDALVARFRVLDVRRGVGFALVTGQTTRLVPIHVALLERPRTPFYRQRGFWAGLILGAAAGVAIGSQ